MPTPSLPTYLSVKQLADRLSVSSKTIRRLIAAGDLPSHRLGGQVRISEQDAVRYLAACRQ